MTEPFDIEQEARKLTQGIHLSGFWTGPGPTDPNEVHRLDIEAALRRAYAAGAAEMRERAAESLAMNRVVLDEKDNMLGVARTDGAAVQRASDVAIIRALPLAPEEE
jgi:hypothetical protein